MSDESDQNLSHGSRLIKEVGEENLPYNFDFQKIKRGIFRYIPLIVATTLLCTAIGSYYCYRLFHTYYTNAVLIYTRDEQKSNEERYQILHLTLPSSVEMITLPVHLKAVKSILGLDLSIEELKKMISVSLPSRESNLVTITVTANNSNLAIDIANTLANVVVKSTQDLNQKQWQTALGYFKNQESSLRQKLEDSNKQIADFLKDHQYLGLNTATSSSMQSLNDSQSKLEAANLQYTQLLVEYENLSREFAKIPDRLPKTLAEDNQFKNKILQLESVLLDARTRYSPENPKIKALEDQLNELHKAAEQKPAESSEPPTALTEINSYPNPVKEKLNLDLVSMQAKLRAAQKLKEELSNRVTQNRQQAANWSEEQSAFAKLLDQKQSYEAEIKSNERTQRMVEIMVNLGKGDLELYQSADKTFSYENSFFVKLLPIISFILGSLLGLAGAVIAELMDKKLRTKKQIQMSYRIPCISIIPEWQLLWKKNAEKKTLPYIRKLVERIQILGPFSSIAITSSISGEGKSSIAYFLALYYQEQGKKTLLLELDPRPNPYVENHSHAPAYLEGYLKGDFSLEDIIYKGKPDRIKTGEHPHMKELLSSPEMTKLWNLLKQTYEMVIIDAPGVVEDDFAVNALALSECCLLVIGSNRVDKKFVDASIHDMEIHGVDPKGIILNRVLPIYLDNLQADAQTQKIKSSLLERFFRDKSSE